MVTLVEKENEKSFNLITLLIFRQINKVLIRSIYDFY
jgi:hypothetical protein